MCYKCGEPGHRMSDCTGTPRERKGNTKSPSRIARATNGCYNCGQDGHVARDCPQGPSRPDRNRGDR